MATLEKIRKKGPLVALVVGFALIAFILGDLFRSGSSFFKNSQFEIANVAGVSIPVQDYQKKVEEITEIVKMRQGGVVDEATQEQLRAQTWEGLIRDNVMTKEYDKIGVGVSDKELFDIIGGKNPDPTIAQLFTNPQTGEFNPQQVVQFVKNIQTQDASNQAFWFYLENELRTKTLFKKYSNLVSKGLYITTREAKAEADAKNKTVNFRFINLNYSTVADNSIKVSESEIKDYYEKHKNKFKQEASRDIEYVSFDAVASADDLAEINKGLEEIKAELTTTPDSSLESFIKQVSESPYSKKHYKQGELSPNIDLFAFNGKAGEIFGPYSENGFLKITKLVDITELPDSVKARHILIQPKSNTPEGLELAKKTADSVKIALKKGSKFEVLALQLSADQGSAAKGGDLGWFAEGQMVPEFNDACFKGKKGDITVATSKFGVHLIEILDQKKPIKKVGIATIERKIEPGKETSDKKYQEAMKFASENMTKDKFQASAKKLNLQLKVANNLAPMEANIAGVENARQVVQWTNKAEKGKVSDVYVCGNSYVIALLNEIREKGFAPVEVVKNVISLEVLKEKKAKQLADKILAQTKSGKSLDQIAAALNVQVLEATDVSYASFNVQNAGYEPALIGTVANLPKDKLSNPIEGKNGVFLAIVTSINTPAQLADPKTEKVNLIRNNRARATYQIYESLKEAANIEDRRANFY